ncbi:phage protein Gp37 [Gilvimarinus sp. 1_MG-2023]|uniref:phage protein Gp37 n=1 Tax=Gilvimarinus sp. 1_MG-2023 TaxID=3062638 RepID=UPI0026E21045|nr:hypothetical protein [Gilvimarinus sp. 1_MG-2023]MDO6747211.1 hypothetical protein [Gilvimarinus sp. 1_MG-2023]
MINDFLADVTAELKNQLAELATDVETHPGRFTEDEIRHIARAPRAVRVAVEDILETKINAMGKRKQHTVAVFAVVICSDQYGADRAQSAIDVVEKLISVIYRNRWNSDDYQAVLDNSISAQNIYSGETERSGIAMWAVTWNQTITGNL